MMTMLHTALHTAKKAAAMLAAMLAALILPLPAAADVAPVATSREPTAAEKAANSIDAGKLVIHGRDLKAITVFQWERDGKLHHAWPEENKAIPYDASRVDVKLYNFPTGQVRKLFYPTGTRTAWHHNETDLIFYSIDVQQVEFLGRQVFDSYPGDASLHPGGTLHHSETIVGGTKLEIAFDPQGMSGQDLITLPARGMALQSRTESVENGKRIVRPAPAGTKGAFQVRDFVFPGYRLIEAHYPAGTAIAPHRSDRETLLYVVSGKLSVTSDTVTDELEPADMVRMVAGRIFARRAIEDSVVLEIDGARAPLP